MPLRFTRAMLPALALSAAAFAGTASADAALVGEMLEFTGADMYARATFEQVGDDIQVTLTTIQEDGHVNTGDWGGFWFNISDDSLLAGLSVVGDDVTAFDFSGSVTSVGSSNNNLNGGGSPAPMDAGIAFGSPGASAGLLETTVFTLSHPDGLTLSRFDDQTLAGRLQSVGVAGGDHEDSSKIAGVLVSDGDPDIPEPASLMLMGLGVGCLIRRR